MEAGVDVYCNQDTASRLNLSGHRLHIIQPMRQFNVGSLTILPFDGVHDIPVLGFLIQNKQNEKLCFIIDSAYCKYRFKNLNYILIGINYCEDILRKNIREGIIHAALGRRIMRAHYGLQAALEFLKINTCKHTKEIHVLHTSETNADKDQIKEAIQKQTGKLVLMA